MHTQKDLHFFLGANSPAGFYSLYDELVDPYTDETLYILKGGPGCGKSSFLKTIAKGLADVGLTVEQIHCSADPDGLDAIYIPALGIAYVDGTAPHVIEPTYMAVFDQYINLGEFYDTDALRPLKSDVIALTHAYKGLYARAYDCIAAAHGVARDVAVRDESVITAVRKRAKGIISREIRKTRVGRDASDAPKTTRRFLSALTHKGHIAHFDVIEALAGRVYHLDNHLGLAHYMLTDLLEAATLAKLDCIVCPSPMDPERLEHLFIPPLDLAFISSNYQVQYEGPAYRHIRLDAMAESEQLRGQKARIRFSKKVFALLMEEAVHTLGEAKAFHDELEQRMNPHVDFAGVYDLAEHHLLMLLDKAMA
ncbi:MAG: hypothetical protein FWE12_08615 [Oscillospiraceae bacterium]|nr:hypothetical protein [Oscillospiraceae bacterium]